MTIESRLAEIRARVDAAADLGVGSILHALVSTTHAPALLAAVEAVLDLHAADEDGDCAECIRRAQGRGDQSYPCPTITTLTAALEVQG